MKIIIMGGKGTAINIADQVVDAQLSYGENIEFLGYSIDDISLGEYINGYPILCSTKGLMDKFGCYSDIKFIFALYKPEKMKERVQLLKRYDIPLNKFCNFVHPSVYLSKTAIVGWGNVVLSHCSIHSNVQIGNYNIINSNVIVEHDTQIKNSNFIAASACVGSNVKLHNGVFIGLNSSIRENVCIQDYAFIGMGSNVLKDTNANTIVYGNPAKEYKHDI